MTSRLTLTAVQQPRTNSGSLNTTALYTALGSNTGVSFTNTGHEVLHISLAALSPPLATTVTTATTGGTVLAGTYQGLVTYVNGVGESTASAPVTVTTTGTTSTVTFASPPAAGNATGWYLYMTSISAPGVYCRQQTSGSPTAIGTNLTLSAPPGTSGANPPAANTTAGTSTATVEIGTTVEGQVPPGISITLTSGVGQEIGPFPADEDQIVAGGIQGSGGLIYVDFGTPAAITGVYLEQNVGV
jgi:hypothetical protein